MKPMTPRERLTAALRRQPVDRIPWTVDLDYYNTALREQGRLDQKYDGVDGFLRQHEELGADPYLCYDRFWPYEIAYDGVTVDARRDENDQVTSYAMEGESLVAIRRYMPESFCWAEFKYPVRTVADLDLLLRILRCARLAPALARHRELQEQWGQSGLLSLGVPRTPIPALITEWCGITATTFLSLDAPDLFAEVLDEMDRLADPFYAALVEYKPVVVHFPDNLSGETVGSFWDQYMAPVYRKRLRQLHEAGILCAIHNDGTMRSLLDRIAAAGFDAAEALTPAPVGDVAPAELRALAGRDDFILWGMVPGVMFCRTWSEARFREHVRDVLDSCTGPMILGSADQVPPDGDLLRVRVVADILAERANG